MKPVDEDLATAEDARLQLALSAGRLGTWSFDLQTGRQDWDALQYELFGVPQGTPITRALFESLVAEPDLSILALTERERSIGTRHASEFRVRRPDGQVRWLRSHSITRLNPSTHALELVGVNWDITEQKLEEERTRQSAAQLQLTLDAARMGTWTYDLKTGRQSWSGRQYELFGLPPTLEPTRELFASLVLPEDLDKILFTEEDLRPGRFHDSEFRIRRPDGAVRWISARSFARHDADGWPVERIGVNWDITEEKEQAAQQAEIERRLALATNAAEIGIWEWRFADGGFYYSQRARQLYGFSPDQHIDYETLQKRTHPEDYRFIEPMLARALDPKLRSQETYRYRISRADTGEERWLLAHGAASFSSLGDDAKPLSYTGTLQDITEDVRLEEALEDERARLRLAISAGDLAIWELDARTNEIVTSADLNRLYRFPDNSKPKTADFMALYAPGEADRVAAEAGAAFQRGETSIRYEAKHLWPDGVVKWIGVRAQINVDKDGSPLRVIGIAMDVTERRLSEERLLTTARELQHRVKNSLTVVQAIAAQTFRAAPTKEAGMEAFGGRLHALAAATELITRGNWATVAVEEVVEEITRPYKNSRFRISGPHLLVNSKDATSLGMALHELCTNAVKYGSLSNDTGEVVIAWETDEGKLHMRWSESGGPEVSTETPPRTGFGTRLLKQGLFDGGGSVELSLRATGVVCDIWVPLPNSDISDSPRYGA